jgi:hypothetical protein
MEGKDVKKVSIFKSIYAELFQAQPVCPASWRRMPSITALRATPHNQQDQLDKADADGR